MLAWVLRGGVGVDILRVPLSVALTIIWFISPQHARANETIIVKHYQHQERYKFGFQVLELALEKLNHSYEIQTPDEQFVNEKRGEQQIIAGQLDLEWMSTTQDRENRMIPIKLPLYRGMLGLRLLLTTPKMQPHISEITTIRDLRKYIGGHGSHWGDLGVYELNGLKVDTSASYENLFTKLIGGRFDYFHRGLNEIWDEQKRFDSQLEIADNIMLFYPHPVYFFVSKHRPKLAEKLRRGLKIALEDGSYKALFVKHFDHYIRLGKLENRNLIMLNNPAVPGDTPAMDTSWWMPEKYR